MTTVVSQQTLRTPLGETAADQLKKGRLNFLRGYVDEVVTLRPD